MAPEPPQNEPEVEAGVQPHFAPDAPAKRPAWQIFAVPAAIVAGCALIAGGLAFGLRDGGLSETQVEAAVERALAKLPVADQPDAISTAPGATQVMRLPDALLAYARTVGIDQAKFKECVAKPETSALLNRHFQQGVSLGVEGTPTFFVNNKKIVGAQPAAVFDEVIQAELNGSPTTLDGYSAAVKTLAQQGRFAIVDTKVDLEGAQTIGSKTAKVMIAEFSDFQCPFCKSWTESYYPTLKPRLGAEIALAYLHFPIMQIHANAGTAGAAAQCAGEQGKFWEMHDLLFAKQKEWQSLQ